MSPTPKPIHSGWCESSHHRKCTHHMQAANSSRPELWCGCDCHDEKAHPVPEQLAGTLEDLEHAAGQMWHVDLPDLLDQADGLDPAAAAFAYDRLRGVIDDLRKAAHLLLVDIGRLRS